MATMTGKEMVKKYHQNGWTLERIKGSHHVMEKDGFPSVSIPVHGSKDLPIGLCNKLLKILKG